jgi:hypothetical protein
MSSPYHQNSVFQFSQVCQFCPHLPPPKNSPVAAPRVTLRCTMFAPEVPDSSRLGVRLGGSHPEVSAGAEELQYGGSVVGLSGEVEKSAAENVDGEVRWGGLLWGVELEVVSVDC